MKRLFRLAIRIYPRQWRERYGAEFAALLDQLPSRFGDLADIFCEAFKMRLKSTNIPELGMYGAFAFILAWSSSQTIGSNATARLSECMFTVLGVPVSRDGNLLFLASHQLSIGYLSIGLPALIAIAILATTHLALVEMRLASRLVFLLGLVPVTIIAWSIRIVVTGVLAEVNTHRSVVTAAGWLSFLACAAALLTLSRYCMRRLDSMAARSRAI